MAKKVTVENLGDVVSDILQEYSDDIDANIAEITKKVGQTGVKALKASSRENFNGTKYASKWTYTTEQKRLYTVVTIYNRMAGLPHLLEHGHALIAGGRNVGRVEGREHIAPVEKELVDTYYNQVVSKL